jgi:hypothetical protein
MVSSQGKKPEEVIAELKKSIEQIRKSKDAPSASGTSSAAASQAISQKSHDEIIADLKALAAKSEKAGLYKKIANKGATISDLNKKVTGTTLTTYVLYKTDKGIGTAGYIVAELPAGTDVSKLKSGAKIDLTITYTSDFVDKNGVIYKINFGKIMTITK